MRAIPHSTRNLDERSNPKNQKKSDDVQRCQI
jgi:hypothetical protein